MLFCNLLNSFSGLFTDVILVAVLLSAGIFLSVKTKFVQLRCLKEGIRNTFSGLFSRNKKDGISPFSALSTSLAAQLGTGNIIGAGSAVLTGGPGALFWIWVSAFFGMATAYCEAFFAQRTKEKGETPGAQQYIKYAFKGKSGELMSSGFSLCAMCALGFTGVAVQSNSIAFTASEGMGISPFITAVPLTLLSAFVITKGNGFITRLAEKTVPSVAGLYFAVCTGVIILNIKYLPRAVYLIFTGAFYPQALSGAITGLSLKTVISQGIKRGLFTNEAGMGSTATIHALSDAPSPHYQGTLSLAGVFTDTFVMMTLTATGIICVLFSRPLDFSSLSPSDAVSLAFSSLLGEKAADIFLFISVSFFAFASIAGWSLSGRSAAFSVFGEKCRGIYLFSSLLFVFAGCLIPSATVWRLTDIFNTLMVLTNVPSLIKLSSEL